MWARIRSGPRWWSGPCGPSASSACTRTRARRVAISPAICARSPRTTASSGTRSCPCFPATWSRTASSRCRFTTGSVSSRRCPSSSRRTCPFELDDTVIDFQVLGTNDDGTSHVLAVSAPKAAVRDHLAALAAAGIDPRLVDLGSLASLNVVREGTAGRPGRIAFVGLDAERTTVALLADGRLAGFRVVSQGSRTAATSSVVSARCAGRSWRSPTALRSPRSGSAATPSRRRARSRRSAGRSGRPRSRSTRWRSRPSR